MCAAPGSKTAQLVELLHGKNVGTHLPTGAVIANDVDEERSHLLIHQLKRLCSPCLMVTNNDASCFPLVEGPQGHPIQFDRVLCDVPCSGDGTFRKNKLIWRTWNIGQGLGLYATQLAILTRGCQLLKIGGRLVYSTCSLNPVENEAVVMSILQAYPGVLELVDVSTELPDLVRTSGLSHWNVSLTDPISGKQTFFDSYEAFMSADDAIRHKYVSIPTTVFAPPRHVCESAGIHRTIRIYPHFQDTGGFYIAIFKKTGPMGRLDHKDDGQGQKTFVSKKSKPFSFSSK
jgi:16S rRNA C967 or C1407 C5-methylase (RsmB/RsmF family)